MHQFLVMVLIDVMSYRACQLRRRKSQRRPRGLSTAWVLSVAGNTTLIASVPAAVRKGLHRECRTIEFCTAAPARRTFISLD
jgi:hypothetical protein